MKTHLTKVSLALVAAAFLLGCQERGSDPVEPQFAEGGGTQFAKPGACPEHPSCGGGTDDGGVDKTAKVDFDSPLLTSVSQEVNVRSNKNSIELGNTTFENALNLSALTGYPSVSVEVDENGDTTSFTFLNLKQQCTTDPVNMDADDPDVLARLIKHLDDAEQNRRFFSKINLKSVLAGTKSKVHVIAHTWTDEDGNGLEYRTSLGHHGLRPEKIVTVKEISKNKFEFTGGSWRSWEPDTPLPGSPHGAFLVCDNTGTVTMTVTDL